MKKDRRWLKSAITAASEPQIAMPWARSTRHRPEALQVINVQAKPRAIAAR